MGSLQQSSGVSIDYLLCARSCLYIFLVCIISLSIFSIHVAAVFFDFFHLLFTNMMMFFIYVLFLTIYHVFYKAERYLDFSLLLQSQMTRIFYFLRNTELNENFLF